MFELENLGVNVARMAAHDAFDTLWKSRRFSRSEAYAMLAAHMSLPTRKAHIRMFDIKQCKETIKWATEIARK
jgi:hypothetical protein